MYFPAIKNAIQALEEKKFYDVSIMYLAQLGYNDLSVVDGVGDGGRDVICSRDDLRIQLSVRRDWERKINEEAATTAQAGKKHLIYVTNRLISPQAEQDFIQSRYQSKGAVDVSIHDLRKISTSLALPGVIGRAYEMLGMAMPSELEAKPEEIAVSTILLFSQEARELREAVIEANVRAQLFRKSGMPESELVTIVSTALPGTNIERHVKAAISRLRSAGRVVGPNSSNRLSDIEFEVLRAAEIEFLAATEADIVMISEATHLDHEKSARLLNIAVELLLKKRNFAGAGPEEESLRAFIAENGLNGKRDIVYDALSKAALAKHKQYGATIDQIFSTNTFDIYRALGRRTKISVLLDSSVAMPVMFGLAFAGARSRYGVAARALKEACDAHFIKMRVPRCYLNEMASHGQKALEWVEVFELLPEEARASLRSSGNAYISHYMSIVDIMRARGDEISIQDFLRYFGIAENRTISYIENKIQTILEDFGFIVSPSIPYDKDIHRTVHAAKSNEPMVLIDHDAVVCTMLKNMVEEGFILATWDKTLIDIVEGLARVYADTPARIIDFLSMAIGQQFESEQSYELLTSLLYTDERVAQRLAEKIDKIRTTDQAYRLREFIDDARKRKGPDWVLKPEDVDELLGGHVYTEGEETT